MTVGRGGPRSHLHEHDRAAVERDDVDVAPEHPFAAADDPVAEATKILCRLVLAATADLVTRLAEPSHACQAFAAAGLRAAFLPAPFSPAAPATTSSRFSRSRVDLPVRSRR